MTTTARAKWRVIAITDKDPHTFAARMENTFQELSDAGWQVTMQHYRGDGALIITACCVEQVNEATVAAPIPPPPQRRITLPNLPGELQHEVFYTYALTTGEVHTEVRPTMADALRQVQEHLAGEIMPVRLTSRTSTTYEPKDIPGLLKLYAKELQHGRLVPG